MPVSVDEVFGDAWLRPAGCVRWGERVPEDRPGVYVVSTTSDLHSSASGIPQLPFNQQAYEDLVKICGDFSIDGQAATALAFEARLQQFWLADEPVLYIGLAGTSLSKRIQQYYSTPIGARSPHSGGWWLKALRALPSLFVHYAPADGDVQAIEAKMIRGFADRLPGELKTGLYDPYRVAPFANVHVPGLGDKHHGFRNHKLRKGPNSPAS